MSLTIVTSGGLSAVNISDGYPTFSLKYFLPLYDPRIDTSIHSTTTTSATSALPLSGASLVSTTHNTLIGEKIWNFNGSTSAYIITDDNFHIYQDDGGTVIGTIDGYEDSTMLAATKVNLLSGAGGIFPLTKIVSGGTAPTISAINAVDGADWEWETAYDTTSANDNATLTLDRNNLWAGVTYTPSTSDLDPLSATAALFKCVIPNTAGDFQFNKVALYVQKVNPDGTNDLTEDPILFGVAVLNNRITIGNDTESIQSFELDVKLQFQVAGQANNNTVYYDTDYWYKLPAQVSSPYGLFAAGDVAIGTSGIGGSWNPNAKLHLTDNQKPQLILSRNYVDNEARFEVIDNGGLRITTSAGANDPLLMVGPGTCATGIYSIAMGVNTSATGQRAIAMGNGTSASGNNSLAVGNFPIAQGNNSLATGSGTYAIGNKSTAMGEATSAIGERSVAIGTSAIAIGSQSTAMGEQTSAFGERSVAMGYQSSAFGSTTISLGDNTIARGNQSVAMGRFTRANGNNSFAIGSAAIANGLRSTAMGEQTSAVGDNSFAVGNLVKANGTNSVAMGNSTRANGNNSLATGSGSIADGTKSTAMGESTSAIGESSLATGSGTKANGDKSTAMGNGTRANGNNSFASGSGSIATGNKSTAMGESTSAYGESSFAIGISTTADNIGSVAMGTNSHSSGQYAFAAGSYTNATGSFSTSLGQSTKATGSQSFAIGYNTSALGAKSTAMGETTSASGEWSTTFGQDTTASGQWSTAFGYTTSASGNVSMAIGRNSVASNGGEFTYANGNLVENGDAQVSNIVMCDDYTGGGGSDTTIPTINNIATQGFLPLPGRSYYVIVEFIAVGSTASEERIAGTYAQLVKVGSGGALYNDDGTALAVNNGSFITTAGNVMSFTTTACGLTPLDSNTRIGFQAKFNATYTGYSVAHMRFITVKNT